EYINNVRIKEAQALLLSTDYKVIDISAKVGYTNTSHFGRVFREMTGYSPLRFRKYNAHGYE
ncbi:MAG: helix-turn-helix transcriptional regulator, partial [Clostridiales bacterium]|nr:helix-turn-helix transcriptional regulator [Clostridiales bacterium]